LILDVVLVVVVIDTMDVEAEDAVIVDNIEEESEEVTTLDDKEGKTAATVATAAQHKLVDSIPAHTHFAKNEV